MNQYRSKLMIAALIVAVAAVIVADVYSFHSFFSVLWGFLIGGGLAYKWFECKDDKGHDSDIGIGT